MKRFLILLALAAMTFAAGGCFFDPVGDPQPATLTWDAVAGTSWGAQPYDGPAWEKVTFWPDGRVCVSLGDLQEVTANHYGSWRLSEDMQHVKIDGLTIFDHLQGRRYHIVEGVILVGSGGRGLRLAYDQAGETVYNTLFNYGEVTALVTVKPWEPSQTILQ